MLISFVLLYWDIKLFGKDKNDSDVMRTYIYALTLWTAYLFGLTEILSLFRCLCVLSVVVGWGIFDVLLLILFWDRLHKKNYSFKSGWRKGKRVIFRRNGLVWIFLLYALVMLRQALLTVPYNWDSMTYHLPRIVHWVQNRSVAHYATNIIRQVASPVLAEFVNLHVYLLNGGSDRVLNLLQCFSYLTCAVLVFDIAKKIKCSRAFCAAATLLYLAMPIGFAESLTTQVDHFATLWLLCFVNLLLDFALAEEKIQWNVKSVFEVCIMGQCVAWGYLAKPSVCVGMLVFVLWLLMTCIIRKDSFKTLLRLALCAVPCISLPLLPELLRNFKTFRGFGSSVAGARQLVGTLNPLLLLVNLCKNIVFNLPTVYIYGEIV